MDQYDTKIDLIKYMWVDLYYMVHLVIRLNCFYILRIGAGRGYLCVTLRALALVVQLSTLLLMYQPFSSRTSYLSGREVVGTSPQILCIWPAFEGSLLLKMPSILAGRCQNYFSCFMKNSLHSLHSVDISKQIKHSTLVMLFCSLMGVIGALVSKDK